jgi:CheY-like chemotaxis protein
LEVPSAIAWELIFQKLLSNGRRRFGVNTTTPACILIVEDERIVAIDLQRQLTHLGYTVVALAVSGVEAIQKALALRPDIVLMDIRLQGDMDGVEAAQQIQAATAIPVVFMTAYVDDATQQRIRATSPYGCLHKPFTPHQIQATLQHVLSGQPPDAEFALGLNRTSSQEERHGDEHVARSGRRP